MGIFDWWRNRDRDGTEGDDNLRDTFRSDEINALGGDDIISLSYGNDQVNGGDGIDTVKLRGSLDEWEVIIPRFVDTPPVGENMTILRHPVYGEKTIRYVERVEDADGNYFRVAPNAIEAIVGTYGDDIITDSYGNDSISALAGNDLIRVSYGDDAIYGGLGIDTLQLKGLLSDYHQGSAADPNNPSYNISSFYSPIYGNKSYDDHIEYVQDETGNAIQVNTASTTGTVGNDILSDSWGRDYISGWGGDDTIFLTTGDDIVFGDAGNDTVHLSGSMSDYAISIKLVGSTPGLSLLSELYGEKLLADVETLVTEAGEVIDVDDLMS